jgi:16S rRNA (guanine1207-N2)-methyltransferase
MTTATNDLVLDALLLPFTQGLLHWPGRGVFLRARGSRALLQALPGVLCEQSFKPEADALQVAGLAVTDEHPPQSYPVVMVLPPRQRDEARALFARAVELTQPEGRILACAPNLEGARSHAADLAQLVGPLSTLSKHKCRVFWSGPVQHGDTMLRTQWQALDAIRPIVAGRFLSRPGVFAWDRIDVGSALLAEHLPHTLRGRVADLGAGFGYLAAELAARCSHITVLDLYEAEHRALQLARLNLASFEARIALGYHWHDVTGGLPQSYDVIVTNPPFHVSNSSRPDIGRRFIAAAAQALRPGGSLWLVANRQLEYERTLAATGLQQRMVAQQRGFKVIEAVRA